MRANALASAGLLALCWAAAAAAEPRYALVVGVSDYANAPRLANPVNDARLISGALEDLGFDVRLAENPTLSDLQTAIIDLKTRMKDKADAIGLFYFAGHGVQHDGQNFLIPRDAVLADGDFLEIEAVSAQWLLGVMETAGAAASFVVLDACRNDPFSRSWSAGARASSGRGLAAMESPDGFFVAFATAPGDVALDGEDGNSPYAAALANEIRAPGVLAETMFRRVTTRVRDTTEERQRPYVEFSFSGDFYFGGQPAAGAAGGAPADLETTLWDFASRINTIEAYQQYLRQYPEGTYAPKAELRIAELAPGQPVPAPLTPDASEVAPVKEEAPSATPAEPAFRVVSAKLSAEPSTFSGLCPYSVPFKGAIEADGPGTVTYRFVRSDGAVGKPHSLVFDAAGTREVGTTWALGATGQAIEGWQVIEVLSPEPLTSDRARFRVACAQAPATPGGVAAHDKIWVDRYAARAKLDPQIVERLRLKDSTLADAVAKEAGVTRNDAVTVAPAPGAARFSDRVARVGATPFLTLGIENDTDRAGSDYRRILLASASPEACRKACADDARCKAWTMVRPGLHAPQAVCYLKDPAPSPTKNACCVSGAK